jgi:hypothetical protein
MNHRIGLDEEKSILFIRYRGDITIDRCIEILSDQSRLTFADMFEARVRSLEGKTRAAMDERIQGARTEISSLEGGGDIGFACNTNDC